MKNYILRFAVFFCFQHIAADLVQFLWPSSGMGTANHFGFYLVAIGFALSADLIQWIHRMIVKGSRPLSN